MPNTDLARDLARNFQLPLQLAKLFALLIRQEHVTAACIHNSLGFINVHITVHKLRKALSDRDIEINTRNRVGYRLDEETRNHLTTRWVRYAAVENLRCRSDDWHSAF